MLNRVARGSKMKATLSRGHLMSFFYFFYNIINICFFKVKNVTIEQIIIYEMQGKVKDLYWRENIKWLSDRGVGDMLESKYDDF